MLLADEPTGALDSATGADLLALLQATCRDTGQTIVMVTHDPGRPPTRSGSCSLPTVG